jgi:hypothetical protein
VFWHSHSSAFFVLDMLVAPFVADVRVPAMKPRLGRKCFSLVINGIFFVPLPHAQTYIHRIGRTARAGRAGSAYTIVRNDEARHFKEVVY